MFSKPQEDASQTAAQSAIALSPEQRDALPFSKVGVQPNDMSKSLLAAPFVTGTRRPAAGRRPKLTRHWAEVNNRLIPADVLHDDGVGMGKNSANRFSNRR